MKVLSLLQPWASLVVMGAKKYECRSWRTAHRGPLLIHASAKKPTKREKLFFERSEYFKNFITGMDLLPYGCLIGKANVADIYDTGWLIQNLEMLETSNWQKEFAFDDYSPGRFAWKLENAERLEFFLPMKGTLGLWDYNGTV